MARINFPNRLHFGFREAFRSSLWAVFLSVGFATADDANPLLLPLPEKESSPGMVMLHGGGSLSDELFEKFIALAGGKRARIVLIPSGTFVRGWVDGRDVPESKEEFEARLSRRFGTWIEWQKKGRIADFRFLYADDRESQDDPIFAQALDQATGVWLPAAYQGKLAWRFTHRYPDQWTDERQSLVQQKLRDVVARGGIVGGLGGGMSALADLMIMGDSGQADGPAAAVLRPGLGLVGGAIVDQNFEAIGGRLERFTVLLKDSGLLDSRITWPATGRNMIGLAVERRTAILLQGRSVQAIGQKNAHLFLKANGDRTVSWRVLSPADGKIDIASASQLSKQQAIVEGPIANRTDDNPFGMPPPLKPGRPGTVVLHGGGSNRDLIPVFPRLSGVSTPRLVHCPAASADWRPKAAVLRPALQPKLEAYFHEWKSMVGQGTISSLDFLTTNNPVDANQADFVRPLQSADAVWFSGGDQNMLAKLFVDAGQPTSFQKELHTVVARGGVVGGSSAGTAVMAQIMTESGEPMDGRPAVATVGHGLGVLGNTVIEQHFQGNGRGGRIERFTGLLRNNSLLSQFVGNEFARPEGMVGLAIEERTALILQENRLRVFGTNHAHMFLKSDDQKTITWHELLPGDSAFIRPAPTGPVLELDEWRIR